MTPEAALLVAAASGIFALLGALGSQIISAFANIRAKRMELVYARRVEAYKELLLKAVEYSVDVESKEKYSELYYSVLAGLTVASDEVFDALANKENGVFNLAGRVYKAKDINERQKYLEPLGAAVDRLPFVMRKDLKRFSGR